MRPGGGAGAGPTLAAMPDPPPFGRPDTPGERAADDVMNVVVPGYDHKVGKILQDMDDEAAADKIMLATEERLMDERPSPTADGIDLAPVLAVDPSFDGHLFLTIAVDCFERIREARNRDDPHFADAELSPWLMDQLRTVIRGDVASHRHHLLAGLEVRSSVIESAAVDGDGTITLGVRFHLVAEELDRADDGTVLAGDDGAREWDERWTFFRDPRTDGSAADAIRSFEPLDRGGWLVAHRGWIVIAIERLGPPDPLDPTNL